MRIGCVVMAAGNGERFGANKLLAEYAGKPLILHALEAVPRDAVQKTVVVTQYDEILHLAQDFGFTALRNDRPELGISRTVRIGTQALLDRCDGILYLVADQPLLEQETVRRICAAFAEHPDRIIVPAAGGRRGSPCLFPAVFFPQLAALEGDRGGSQVIKKHPEAVLPVEVPAQELFDVDTAEALSAIDV